MKFKTMNKIVRNILIGLGVVITLFILWFFKSIVAYILISAVLSLIGRPIVEFLGKLRIRNVKIPKALRAFLTLLVIWAGFIIFFRIFIPIIAKQANELSGIDINKTINYFQEPIHKTEQLIQRYALTESVSEFSLQDFLTNKLRAIFDLKFITATLSTFASILGNIFIALFAISFITFFFLKDEKLFRDALLTLVPPRHKDAFRHGLKSTRKLLMRYFTGILFEVSGIIILVTAGMTIVGVEFQRSILIGLIAGILNVVPYLGPLIGSTLGVLLGIITHLHMDLISQLLPLIMFMILVFVIVQLIDNLIFQPFIYSNSVHAHPLEIFLVILIAANLAGIPGMILAIPTYTVLRIFAKEFFHKFEFVKKLTQNIE
jgi:predicted PurR-regulated permease PerM